MIACNLRDRLTNLTNALVDDDDVDSAWLASILVAAQESIENGELGALALQVSTANQARQDAAVEMTLTKEVPNPEIQGRAQLRHLGAGFLAASTGQ
jgi:hypothetical protein